MPEMPDTENATPVATLLTDWDLFHRWEWFRRARWKAGFRATVGGRGGGLVRAVADLARQVDAGVLLDASCGIGRRVVMLAEKGLNIVGSDASGVGIRFATEFARDENVDASFFRSAWAELPKNIPHQFDGILAPGLALEPRWDDLGAAFVGLFHSLRPGGFLMFTGPGESDPEDLGRRRLLEEWNQSPRETVEWLHRDGRLTCCLVKQKVLAADFMDDRLLYASDEDGETRLEVTTIRRPGYWAWRHWRDLTRMAGFCHLETRRFDGYAPDGGVLTVNVAWKAKSDDAPDDAARVRPYEN